MRVYLYFALACCARVLLAMHWASAPEGFLLSMPPIAPFNFNELLLFRINLDIPAFVQTAVRNEMNRDEILVYLHLITNTPSATEKMWRFTLVAQDKALTRNEILVWLHVSYGGLLDPKHISRKLCIPPHFAEQALAALQEKGILGNGKVV
jgi:hypothetical protein